MASMVAHRMMDDGLNSQSGQQPDVNQPVSDAPDYGQSEYYKSEEEESSETMHSLTADESSDPVDFSSREETDYGKKDFRLSIGKEGKIKGRPGFITTNSARPDPPVIPGRSVMLAKGNIVNTTPGRNFVDNTGGNVCARTSEPGEKEKSTTRPFSRTRRKRKSISCSQLPRDSRCPESDSGLLWGYTGKQWLLLLVLLSGTLTSSFAVCLFPPFFPKIAQEKGATATIFGMIIGTNCLTAFLVTPLVGKKLQHIGVKFAFTAGLFCSGGCCVLSGFLEWFPPGALFVVMAILIRMTHAIANAGISTSTFAYIAAEFPDSVAKIFAFTRTTMNVAQMLGPVVGGALYSLGGFKMPFLVMGTIQMTMTFVAIGYLVDFKDLGDRGTNSKKREIQITHLFAIPGIWLSFLTFVFSTMSNGFLSVTLEPLVLRKFNLGPLYIGLLFGLKDGANSLASPLWGWLCDRYRRVKIFILVASCLAFLSFVLLGPLPGLPIKSTLGIVIAALILNGFGIGGQQVAGVVDAMREAVCAGFPDEAGTHGCVAGLWASLSGAGRFTSRAGTGILVDHIGFRKSSVVVVALHGAIIALTTVYLLFYKEKPYKRFQDMDNSSNGKYPDTVGENPNRVGTIFTTTPSEPVTAKAITIDVPNYREDIEDSLFLGSSPIPTPTRYARESCNFSSPHQSSSSSS
ncbi:MFS-type transporter SLC18B1-like [Palaemon carinicauda]|uniref:MFS-type transporter SLC18B1-like n=1 Tax=Palaemon carinicauda TaxID=392227 RepID=UPI0035B69448